MAKKTFYEKVGRRYKEVSYYDSELFDSFVQGTHLVMVYKGGKSTRFNIDPAFAPMIAAGRYAETKIAEAIYEASQLRPSKPIITLEQRLAWEKLSEAFGDEMYSIHRSSAVDIAQAGIVSMQREADKLLTNPAVKSAYEQFMLVCKLTMEEQE